MSIATQQASPRERDSYGGTSWGHPSLPTNQKKTISSQRFIFTSQIFVTQFFIFYFWPYLFFFCCLNPSSLRPYIGGSALSTNLFFCLHSFHITSCLRPCIWEGKGPSPGRGFFLMYGHYFFYFFILTPLHIIFCFRPSIGGLALSTNLLFLS